MSEKVHTFPGNIKITVEEFDENNVEVDIDTGDVNFKSGCLPKGFNGSGSSTSHRYKGEKYYNIPTIFMDRDDDSWWINLSCLDGEHNICYGKVIEFPYVCTKDWCEKFLQGFTIVVNTLVAEGYIKEEEIMFNGLNEYQNEIVYKYGEIVVKITKFNDADIYTINIDSGNLDLCPEHQNTNFSKFYNLNKRIELNKDYRRNSYWFISDINKFNNFCFINGAHLNIHEINNILNAVKNTAEFVEQNGGIIKDKVTVKLITREEMLDLVDNQKILPAKVSLMQWERKLEKIKAEHLTECPENNSGCALCRTSAHCYKCSLTLTGNACGNVDSVWKEVYRYREGNHKELIRLTEKMIDALKKAVEYEENQNKKEEVYYAGKMKITLIPTEKVFKIKIDGMKSYAELPEEYYNRVFKTKCYYNSNYTAMGVYDSNKSEWLISAFDDCQNIIRTHKDAMEIVECLKECSNILHEINEPKVEITNIGKMTLKAEKISNDVYQCSIEGMQEYNNLPCEYIGNKSITNCCMYINDRRFRILNKYYKNFIFSQYSGSYDTQYVPIDNFKVTSEELIELKKLLKTCSENLHEINHKYKV